MKKINVLTYIFKLLEGNAAKVMSGGCFKTLIGLLLFMIAKNNGKLEIEEDGFYIDFGYTIFYEDLGVGEKTAVASIQRLRELGYIEVHQGSDKTGVSRIFFTTKLPVTKEISSSWKNFCLVENIDSLSNAIKEIDFLLQIPKYGLAKKMTGGEFKVYVGLLHYFLAENQNFNVGKDDFFIDFSYTASCNDLGVTAKTATSAIKKLSKKGFIEVEEDNDNFKPTRIYFKKHISIGNKKSVFYEKYCNLKMLKENTGTDNSIQKRKDSEVLIQKWKTMNTKFSLPVDGHKISIGINHLARKHSLNDISEAITNVSVAENCNNPIMAVKQSLHKKKQEVVNVATITKEEIFNGLISPTKNQSNNKEEVEDLDFLFLKELESSVVGDFDSYNYERIIAMYEEDIYV